jgi:hypothetical protein
MNRRKLAALASHIDIGGEGLAAFGRQLRRMGQQVVKRTVLAD